MNGGAASGASSEDLARLLRPFGVCVDDLRPMAASQNRVYSAKRQGRDVIVRVSSQRHRTKEEIEGELRWILHLAERGLPVCVPQLTESGALCESLERDGRVSIAAVFAKAPGRKPERPDLSETFCEKVGALIGHLHRASREASASGFRVARGRWSTSRLLTHDFERPEISLSETFRSRVADLVREIDSRSESAMEFGLIHGDVNIGNLHLGDDGGLWVFDFDNCEYGYFLQDLTTFLYDDLYSKLVKHVPARELTSEVGRRWDAILRGYRRDGGFPEFTKEDVFRHFLLREAILYVHYHRIFPPSIRSDPFVIEMARHVEENWHPLEVGALAV